MKLWKSLKSALPAREEVRALKLSLDADFPPELGDFTFLEELYLDGDVKTIPAMSWKHLRQLSLKFPSFEGDLSFVFTLPALENLKFIETPFHRLVLPLGQVPAPLKFLTIKDCGLQELPEEIGMLRGLNELNLSGNALSGLPHGFVDLVHLRRLNLDTNRLHHFPDLLGRMPALRAVSLDNNLFDEEEKARIQRTYHLTVH